MRSPTRNGPRSVLTMDQSPVASTPSLTPSMVRVAALAHAVPDIAFTLVSRHVLARGARHLAGAFGGDRPLLARVAVKQRVARPSPRHPGKPPRQADRIENSGVEAERPGRRDQMRGIAHEKHAIAAPLRRHAVMNAVDDGVEDFHLLDGTDEANDLRAEIGDRGLGDSGGERIKETPA